MEARFIKALQILGFEVVREGNHVSMVRENPDGSRTPAHHAEPQAAQEFHPPCNMQSPRPLDRRREVPLQQSETSPAGMSDIQVLRSIHLPGEVQQAIHRFRGVVGLLHELLGERQSRKSVDSCLGLQHVPELSGKGEAARWF